MQQVEELLASMEIFIEAVMSQRRVSSVFLCSTLWLQPCRGDSATSSVDLQEKAISEAEFEQLIAQLEQTTSADRALRIATAAQFCFFTSLQVQTNVAMLQTMLAVGQV